MATTQQKEFNIDPSSEGELDSWLGQLPHPRPILLIGSASAVILLLLQFFLLQLGGNSAHRISNEILNLISSLMAFAGLAIGAFYTREKFQHLHHSWLFLTAAGLCWAAGNLVSLLSEIFFGSIVFPSLADLFYLMVYPCLIIGIQRIPDKRRTTGETAEYVMDVAVMLLSASLIFWSFLIGPIVISGTTNWLSLILTAAYPIADVILLWAAFVLVTFKFTRQPRQPLWLLFTALVAMVILDTLLTFGKVTGIDSNSHILVLLKTGTPLLLMGSGLVQALKIPTARPESQIDPNIKTMNGLTYIRLFLPYLWFGCAFAILYYGPASTHVISPFTTFVWVAVILGLVILRQLIVTRENQNLTQQLHRLNTDLEQLFIERTAALIRTNEELRREVFERGRMERLLRERDDKLVYFSFHDTLTGLPNRALLIERLTQAIRRVNRQEKYHYAVLYLDFDGFKYINDSLGHQAGDRLLIAIARRLEKCVRDIDTVARLGGDEFVIMADGIFHDEDALTAVERVQEILTEPFELEGHRVFMSASIGVVIGEDSYDQASDLLRDADLAMYQAKASGKSRYVIFSQEMRISALNRLILETDMRSALEQGEFSINYQPIMALDKNVLVGFEALLRWRHPDHGNIPPDDFIPVAEASGLIVPIFEWTLQEACSQLQTWREEFHPKPDLTVSINLSAVMFSEPDLAQMIRKVLDETGLPAGNLKLEITETSIVEDAESATRMLQACREMGVQVYIDDFGTGYSALSYLHQFPIDTLKIDRAFIARIQEDGGNTEVVRTIIALARELNLEVIAEGVETEIQFDFLKKLGCQGGQGYYIAYPLEALDAHTMIASQAKSR